MGLLRFLRGKRSSLHDTSLTDGSVYVCTDDGTVHFDYIDANGNVQRQQVNAGNADSLAGATLSTSLNPTDQEIPTSNVIIENTVLVTPQELTEEELTQVRHNLKFIGKDVAGQTFTVDGTEYTASVNAEIFGDYDNNIAIGQWSIAEGSGTVAKGRASHAEGAYSQALQDGTHVEGYGTKATGFWSHAEGEMTVVSSYASHAEGSYTKMPDGTTRYGTASGYASHVEGGGCHTTGVASHAEGIGTTANGRCAHVEGIYTIATGQCQHVEGNSNIEDTEDQYIHIVGNGTSPTDRSNAHTLDWSGNAWFAGDVYVGSASGTNKDDNSQKLATEEFVETFTTTAITEIAENKQNKNIIVTKTADGKATMLPTEIMAHVRAGTGVYYTSNVNAGTLHPYLEGSNTAVFFYSNYIDNDRIMGSGILILADGTIQYETYQSSHLQDKEIHITAEERERWNNPVTWGEW